MKKYKLAKGLRLEDTKRLKFMIVESSFAVSSLKGNGSVF